MGYSLDPQTGKLLFNNAPGTTADFQALADRQFDDTTTSAPTVAALDAVPRKRLGMLRLVDENDSLYAWMGATDGWKKALDVIDTDWVNVTVFGNGFTAYNSTGWSGVKYRLFHGEVFVNGAAGNYNSDGSPRSWAAGAIICNIPDIARPPLQWQGSNVAVYTDGNVAVSTANSGAVSFSANYPRK